MIEAKQLRDAVGAALAGRPRDGAVRLAPGEVHSTWGEVAEVRTLTPGVDVDIVIAGDGLHRWLGSRSGEIELEVDDGILVARCGRARFECRASLTEVGEWSKVEVEPAGVTLADLARVAFAASADASRPILCAVMVGPRGVMATDSYRAAYIEVDRPNSLDQSTMLVPAPAVAVAAKWVDADATVATDGRAVTFTDEVRTVRCQLTEGDAPSGVWGLLDDAEKVVERTLDVPSEPLLAALTATSAIAEVVRFDAQPGTLRVEAHDHHGTQIVDELDDITLDGGELTWAMNPRFIAQAVEAAGSERVLLEMADELKPMVIHSEGMSQLLMPIRVL